MTKTRADSLVNQKYLLRSLMNGTFQEPFDALVTSDGATVTMSLEQTDGGDLTMQFSDVISILDCTPAQTIALTAGSDTSPTENFIYIPQSTKILTKDTSSWPAEEHIKVAYFYVPSAGFTQTNGPYVNQNWNNPLAGTNDQGYLTRMAERSRRLGAIYFSGIGGNGTDGYLTPTASNTELKSTSGSVYQMHKHTVPAFDTSGGDVVLIKNWNGDAYHAITNLFDITDDSGGNTIGNNKYFNIILWAVANKTGEFSPMMINLPSGSYNTQSGAEADSSGYDDFVIPAAFDTESSTGFLIARITIQMAAIWVVASTVDLRGPSILGATGGAASSQVEFPDNTFKIFDEADVTKIAAFDAGTNIATGTERTLQVPNASGIIALTAEADGQIDLEALTNYENWTSWTPTLGAQGSATLANTSLGRREWLRIGQMVFYILTIAFDVEANDADYITFTYPPDGGAINTNWDGGISASGAGWGNPSGVNRRVWVLHQSTARIYVGDLALNIWQVDTGNFARVAGFYRSNV